MLLSRNGMEDGGDAPSAETTGLCLFDLAGSVDTGELQNQLDVYGDVVSLKQVHSAGDEVFVVEYASRSSAEEAQKLLNHALVRNRVCRCLSLDSLKAIRETYESAQRLFVDGLDEMMSNGTLCDICRIFGAVLDCKVELDNDARSCGYGFVHFETEEAAVKACKTLDKSQLGAATAVLRVRTFEPSDAWLFTGCSYAFGAASGFASLAPAKHFDGHDVEVIDDIEQKQSRLQELVSLYGPEKKDRPMIVVADEANVDDVLDALRSASQELEVVAVRESSSEDTLTEHLAAFGRGDIAVLVLSNDVHWFNLTLGRSPTVLVNFDVPRMLPILFHRIAKCAAPKMRTHSFFSITDNDHQVAQVMAAFEEAGQEAPSALFDYWMAKNSGNVGSED